MYTVEKLSYLMVVWKKVAICQTAFVKIHVLGSSDECATAVLRIVLGRSGSY